MPHFICLLKPTNDTRNSTDYASTFKQHGAYLKEMSDKGKIIFAGYTNGEKPGELSLAVLNVEDKALAVSLMQSSPAVSAGLLSSEIEPFEVFL